MKPLWHTLGVSVRAANALCSADITRMDQLREAVLTRSLLKYRNVGRKTFNEIVRAAGWPELQLGYRTPRRCPHCNGELHIVVQLHKL
jgi:DNA-directed RNA polymerase alpha subunit